MTHAPLSLVTISGFDDGMKEASPEIDIKAISQRHICSIDKLYRMHGGLSSNLISYDDRVIELEIRTSPKWTKSPEVTARQLAECWKRNRELSDAVGFVVHLYDQLVPTGVSMPAKEATLSTGLEGLLEQLKQLAEPKPDILVGTLNGLFDDDEQD
tara:strand:+ start:598 stop:1065 length:468 start_codon:yes stop_codon:yes gene_type:complete